MIGWLILALRLVLAVLKSRRSLLRENPALRHQLLVLSRGSKRPRLMAPDRALWVWLPDVWPIRSRREHFACCRSGDAVLNNPRMR